MSHWNVRGIGVCISGKNKGGHRQECPWNTEWVRWGVLWEMQARGRVGAWPVPSVCVGWPVGNGGKINCKGWEHCVAQKEG